MSGASPIRTMARITWTEAKLFMREPMALFFTLLFPLLLLVIFGSIFGNEPSPELGGLGTVDLSVPGYIGMIIGTSGLIALPVALATYREKGVLRRLRATPIRPSVLLGGEVALYVALLLLGVLILTVAARLIYSLVLPVAPLALLPALLVASVSFFTVGFVVAGLLPTARAAQAVGMAILFPMLFLSGAAMPREIMPDAVQRVAEWLPLTHVVILIEDLWFTGSWNLTSLAVVLAILVVGLLLSARTFRWE